MDNFWQQMLFWTLAVLIGLFVGIFWVPIILDASVSSNLMQTFLGTLAGAAIVTILNIFYQQQQDKNNRNWQKYLITLEQFHKDKDSISNIAGDRNLEKLYFLLPRDLYDEVKKFELKYKGWLDESEVTSLINVCNEARKDNTAYMEKNNLTNTSGVRKGIQKNLRGEIIREFYIPPNEQYKWRFIEYETFISMLYNLKLKLPKSF